MPDDSLTNGSFESGLDGWTVGRDLPEDPNKSGDQPVDSHVAVSDDHAADGDQSCKLTLDGRQVGGTLWVQQAVPLADADRLVVDYYSPQESFNTITRAAVYTGPEKPLSGEDFDTSHAVENHEGWQSYEYNISHEGNGVVAVGITVVWETEVTRYLDAVRLQ